MRNQFVLRNKTVKVLNVESNNEYTHMQGEIYTNWFYNDLISAKKNNVLMYFGLLRHTDAVHTDKLNPYKIT